MADFFEAINSNEDRRIKRTKKALRESLFKLLKEKNINQITVTQLTKLADINRSTFYIYYTDIFDMLDKIQDEIYQAFVLNLARFSGDVNKVEDLICFCESFLNFCKENYELCRFVTRNDCNNQLADRIKEAVRNMIPDSEKHFDKRDPRYYLTTFALSGMLGVILGWVEDSMEIPSGDMARFLVSTYALGSVVQKETKYYENYSFFQK